MTKARLPPIEYSKLAVRTQDARHACNDHLAELRASSSRKAENQYSAGHDARNLVDTCVRPNRKQNLASITAEQAQSSQAGLAQTTPK